jgi:serine/threonine protein kinase
LRLGFFYCGLCGYRIALRICRRRKNLCVCRAERIYFKSNDASPMSRGSREQRRRMNPSSDTGSDVRDGRKDRFGRYRLRGILGQGGMGRLYVAEQSAAPPTGDGKVGVRIIALKRILPHLADNPQFREMFLTEARVATGLKHRNIVETYEFGEIDGQCFISMEYLSGEDLAAIFAVCNESAPMPVDIVLALIQQCARGLHYAHDARDELGRPMGLVHRDVNPWNIFVTYYGGAKLLDFGIVKHATGNTRTAPGVFKGKYAYCAPEQFSGEAVDRQSDVFGLGIVLWECLTGKRLFESGSEVATIDAVRSRVISPPGAHRPGLPRGLDEIVLGALARERSKRFASAHQLADALEAVHTGGGVPVASPGRISAWMTSLFGQERAALRNVISHAVDVEGAIARLAALGVGTASIRTSGEPSQPAPVAQPRSIWATEAAAQPPRTASAAPRARASGASTPEAAITPVHGTPALLGQNESATLGPITPQSPSRHTPRWASRKLLVLAALGATVLAFGATRMSLGRRGSAADVPMPVPASTGELLVRSHPGGAHILIDGEPTGRTTPAVLSGLAVGRAVEVRLEKAGFAPVSVHIDLRPGRSATGVLELTESTGVIRWGGLPATARIFVDELLVTERDRLTLPLGPHALRVETADDVLLNRTVEVHRGEQEISVAPARQKGR